MWHRHRILLGHLFVLSLLVGCDRQFADISPPSITIIEPDFTEVQTQATVDVFLKAESFRNVGRVELDGEPLAFDPNNGLWEGRIALAEGLGRFVVAAYDEGDVVRHDTISTLRVPFRVTRAAMSLPQGRGGHATTVLSNGDLLVTGGSASNGQPAHEAFLLRAGTAQFTTLDAQLAVARTGHSASLLPNGTVLIVGGSNREGISDIEHLVSSVERYNPITQRFETIPTTGAPIRRAFHTTTIRQAQDGVIVHLFGGRGDINYNPPRLGTRQDIRTFLLRNDSLIAISPPLGPFLESIAGQTQTPLNELTPGQDGRFLVTGSYFLQSNAETPSSPPVDPSDVIENVSFILDFTSPLGILTETTPPLRISRTRHAATLLQEGFVVITGGKQDVLTQSVVTPEIYIESLNRFFAFPAQPAPAQRHGQTATRLSNNRILLLGGFTPQGTAVVDAQYFDLTL